MAKNNESYLSNPKLKKIGVKMSYTPEQLVEYARCIQDPVYFIKKYVQIIHVDRGIVPFELWPFQEAMVRDFHNNRFSIAKMPRQVGKTTTVSAYILWCLLFNDNFYAVTLAHKHSASQETVERIKMAYENLPLWLQQGVVEWNKTSIELENGSGVTASSTSASAIRGQTISLVYLDELAFVPSHIQETFFASVYPTISSGKSTKVIITSTPNGMNMFYKLWKDAEGHKNDYKTISIHWSDVPGRDTEWKEQTIRNTSQRQFDQEFETHFLGSSMTLIDGRKLAQVPTMEPIHYTDDGFKFYDQVDRSHTYIMVVDTARGTGLDYSAFVVFDTSTVPFRVVATFRNNNVHTIVFPKYVLEAAVYFNNCYILVETNDLGQQIVDILREDLDYDGLISTTARAKHHEASDGFGSKKTSIGVRTTKTVKRLGCSTLKSMVESDQLEINDFDLLSEMSRFTLKNGSYEAESGNDDLVMCCVLFGWLSTQDYFKELTNADIVRSIYKIGTAEMDDMMVPFGVIDDGRSQSFQQYGDDLWSEVD